MTAGFVTPLRVQFLAQWDGWRQLVVTLEPLRFRSVVLDREITVPAGFVSDRESRPTAGPISGPEMNPAGVLHDYLYRTHEVSRDEADAVYHEALLSMGLDPVWADQRYRAVAQLGASAFEHGPERFRLLNVLALDVPMPYGATPA